MSIKEHTQRMSPALGLPGAWLDRIVDRRAAASFALFAAGIAIWTASLSHIALGDMTDIGLASALPVGTWLSFALIASGCAIAWRIGSQLLMVTGVLTTILALHGLGVFGEPTMRFAVAWRHVGVADHIATTGSINPNIDAYFNWPGFFVLAAFVADVAGLPNAEPIGRVAPLLNNAMYLPPLVVIGRALVSQPRVVWLGIWLFYVNSWIGQDYFSPQGLNYFMYLAILAILLSWFKGGRPAETGMRMGGRLKRLRHAFAATSTPVTDIESTRGQRVFLVIAILLIATAVCASHQLTPFALVATTGALTIVGACRLHLVPIIVLLVTVLWTFYMAETYLIGHLAELTQDVGAVNRSVDRNVGGRLEGSPGHEAVVRARLGMTALLWLAAAVAAVRGALARYPMTALVALAAAPFPLLALQPYGGEVLLRIAFLCMPFMTLLAAMVFAGPKRVRLPRFSTTVLVAYAVVLLAAFPVTRYGNERMDYYTNHEVLAVKALYRAAPEGSLLLALADALPWRYTKYAEYESGILTSDDDPEVEPDAADSAQLVRAVATRMQAGGKPSFLILTRSTDAQIDLFGPWGRDAQDRLRRLLMASPRFRVVYRNKDATIFTLNPAER